MADLTVLILTHNEAVHIERCIANALKVASDVVVVDSASSDETREVAKRLGARVFVHPWTNHADQINWALSSIDISTGWIMRLDADEYMDETLVQALRDALSSAPENITGLELRRYAVFQGKRIRFAPGVSPGWNLRVWRRGAAICECRWMDEHMLLRYGKSHRVQGYLNDHNLKTLTWWIQKHNTYASREAVDLLNIEYGFLKSNWQEGRLQSGARFKRAIKNRVYSKLPGGVRALCYFLYRMLLQGGVLDGRRGVAFHFMQGFWYRALVDLKVEEVKRYMSTNACSIFIAIRQVLGISLSEGDSVEDAERGRS